FLDTDDLDNVILAPPTAPASLTLSPHTALQEAGSTACVAATVVNVNGDPVPGTTVDFSTSGATSASGSGVTDDDGIATFCFDGPALRGVSGVAAHDGAISDTASVTWTQPASADCKVTGGGVITTDAQSTANFGGNAKVAAGRPSGQELYQDHGDAARTVKSA